MRFTPVLLIKMVFDTVQVSYPQIIMQYIIIKIDN
jgi:hypothetical protein